MDAVGARQAGDAEELRGADVGQDHELLDDLLALEALLGASPLPGWWERSVEARPGKKNISILKKCIDLGFNIGIKPLRQSLLSWGGWFLFRSMTRFCVATKKNRNIGIGTPVKTQQLEKPKFYQSDGKRKKILENPYKTIRTIPAIHGVEMGVEIRRTASDAGSRPEFREFIIIPMCCFFCTTKIFSSLACWLVSKIEGASSLPPNGDPSILQIQMRCKKREQISWSKKKLI